MKILILAVILMIPGAAAAQVAALPQGCYVTFDNPYQCYGLPPATELKWMEDVPQSDLSKAYGQIVGNITYNANTWRAGWKECVAQRTTIESNYNSCEANRQEWITYGGNLKTSNDGQAALIKKLRKKCGKPCKRIK